MKRNFEQDEQRVLEWFHKYALGYKKALRGNRRWCYEEISDNICRSSVVL